MTRIRLRGSGAELTATLLDNPTARDLVSLLPLTVTIGDHASTEKVADLPRHLTTDGAPPGFDPDVGDVTTYAPWGNLALFYEDFGYAAGLVQLGAIDSGLAHLRSLSGEITIEVIAADS
ncbi:MAG: cyclophilin-like fold protein [Actinomycetota bacterium]|nr:cyclophilin-like fold protein [Actinomycetota bacterium]